MKRGLKNNLKIRTEHKPVPVYVLSGMGIYFFPAIFSSL